jgi:ElaA protein
MQYHFKHFSELALTELYAILAARQEVFIVEQNCPYLDADGYDDKAHHLWSVLPNHNPTDSTAIAAYLRIFAPNIKYAGESSLGRIITTNKARGSGAGRAIVQEGIARCQAMYPHCVIRIGAQQYLEKFYGSFGFITVSDPYMEDGIPHIAMTLQPT